MKGEGSDEVGLGFLYLNKKLNLLYIALFIAFANDGSRAVRVVAEILAGLLIVTLLHRIIEKLNCIEDISSASLTKLVEIEESMKKNQ